jgi:hypothetical protein
VGRATARQGAPAGTHGRVCTRAFQFEIYGPKSDGSYWLELRQENGQSLVVPASESDVLKHLQRLIPYGLVVPDDPS